MTPSRIGAVLWLSFELKSRVRDARSSHFEVALVARYKSCCLDKDDRQYLILTGGYGKHQNTTYCLLAEVRDLKLCPAQ